MVNYVNTVLVSNKTYSNAGDTLFVPAAGNNYKPSTSDAGKFIIMNCDPNLNSNGQKLYDVSASNAGSIQTIKVGYITNKSMTLRKPDGTTAQEPIIKWSNEIKAADIKSYTYTAYAADTEDVANINFRSLDASLVGSGKTLSTAGKRIIVRLTFKDMPHRYRKWTESYEYITKDGDTVNSIVRGIVSMINNDWKRARVVASLGTASAGTNTGDPDTIAATAAGSEAGANTVILTAMPYDDDNSVDSLNWANKVRFNANIYYTDPAAEGWESLNKHFPIGVQITKTPGKTHVASAKLVRDREAWGMGYQGILNRGEGTWPIIKPEMVTELDKHYNAITLEFENMYRAADDIQRKTKQNLEVYAVDATEIKAVLDAFVAGTQQDEIVD
jgi:hypothetical protein